MIGTSWRITGQLISYIMIHSAQKSLNVPGVYIYIKNKGSLPGIWVQIMIGYGSSEGFPVTY